MRRAGKVAELLRARGVAQHVQTAGLEGLVGAWEQFAAEVERGYAQGLDDWLNDVDRRDILDAALRVASADERRALRKRVRIADELVRAHLQPAGRCLWGAANAAKHGWNPGRQWWYFLEPRIQNEELAHDLARVAD
ncbi:MAG: hypothetical protein JNL28_10305 [Planctomycetes bacterium]|nr:hypothetical protein [Planctomycetota bacterium]